MKVTQSSQKKKGKPLAHPKEGYAGAMQISDCAIAPASPS